MAYGVFCELWHGDPGVDPKAGRHGNGEACKSDEGQECALHGWRVTRASQTMTNALRDNFEHDWIDWEK